MNRPIGDRVAIAFSTGFYDALGAGMSYPDCFDIGRSAIDLGRIPESETPVIKARKRASQPVVALQRISHSIDTLKKDENPFTDEVLEHLKRRAKKLR
ncbi:hypothetical protein [Lyngbya sp. CCY1209]|uniref:hypothetical protein n=1 Tax=Lyngbya sp. CCY1209 TaxID=2886103 RepID=UPI002D217137|nr:hypothetical protein [Lyngbya sp. CCY1209]MEB3886185.1 hypothetical protein [Lyngbya sp. CCY1209]